MSRTGCGPLLDLNDLWMAGRNHGRDVRATPAAMQLLAVGKVLLAGQAVDADASGAPLPHPARPEAQAA